MKYILLDTKNITGNKYNFKYNFDQTIEINEYIKLNLMLIPRMSYFINNTNNTFKIKFYQDINNPVIFNFTLTNQSYTPLTFCEAINNLFGFFVGFTFNVFYNSFNYSITFTSSVKFDLDLTLSSFHRVISLEKKVYYSDTFNNINGFINFNTPYYIKFKINNLTSTNILNNNNNLECSWIVPILNKNFGEIIEYTEDKYYLKNETKAKINNLDITILDDSDNLFDNNNYNWFGIFEYQ